ncbi:MAG: hypothetical protein FJY82_04500 [Candidatus Aminicenantes bacterium]|nr:hypothetical protein [Candidatus Aminicenantes bacterium]
MDLSPYYYRLLADFPTEFHASWQWRDAMSRAQAIVLSDFDPALRPIVRIIDDWLTNRPLGLIFEVKVGKGGLIVTGIDLLTDQEKRPEAGQLLLSLARSPPRTHSGRRSRPPWRPSTIFFDKGQVTVGFSLRSRNGLTASN